MRPLCTFARIWKQPSMHDPSMYDSSSPAFLVKR